MQVHIYIKSYIKTNVLRNPSAIPQKQHRSKVNSHITVKHVSDLEAGRVGDLAQVVRDLEGLSLPYLGWGTPGAPVCPQGARGRVGNARCPAPHLTVLPTH